MKLIVLFSLKNESSAAEYENWAKTVDIPTVKRLTSVDEFKLYKTVGVWGSDNSAPYAYIEVIEVNDPDQLGLDVATETMREVAAQFQAFADQPCFIKAIQIE
jgi:hypothetical protein